MLDSEIRVSSRSKRKMKTAEVLVYLSQNDKPFEIAR